MFARCVLSAVALVLGCSRSPEAPPPPALPLAPAAAEPAAPPPPPGPAPAAEAIGEVLALEPGEVRAPLSAAGETAIDPSATFRVTLSGRSLDARLALYDGSDAAVPSTATAEVGETTLLTLSPTVPLTPGSSYELRVDGAVTREIHLGGRAYTPAIYALRAAGDALPPKPAKKTRTHRR